MRWLALVAILGAGCLSQLVPAHKSAEAESPGAPDLAEAAQPEAPAGDDGGMMMHDGGGMMMHDGGGMMMHDAAPAGGDLAGATGLAAFGQPCTVGANCQSGICQMIMQALLCTQACTVLGAADPTCPNDGMCNLNGYCKP